jgi:hypothetical protein
MVSAGASFASEDGHAYDDEDDSKLPHDEEIPETPYPASKILSDCWKVINVRVPPAALAVMASSSGHADWFDIPIPGVSTASSNVRPFFKHRTEFFRRM